MKKYWFKTLILASMVVLAMASFTFADETDEQLHYDRMVLLLETYHPDVLDDWINKWEEHQGVHDDLEAVRENLKSYGTETREAIKGELEAYKNTLKAAVEAGEMTSSEAREAFQVFLAPYLKIKESRAIENEAIRAELESIKSSILVNKTDREAKRLEVKNAIQQGDDNPIIQGLIDELIALQEIHLGYDHTILDLLTQVYNGLE